MKNNVHTILLLGLIASLCSAEQTFEEARKEISPRVKTLGYDYSYPETIATDTYYSVQSRASFDIGGKYEAPIYSHEQYYIGRQRASLFIGGRQSVSFTFFLVRINFYFDLWPAKLTLENYIDKDLLGNGNYCWLGSRFFDTLRFLLYVQLDYQDCAYGILGVLLDSTNEAASE